MDNVTEFQPKVEFEIASPHSSRTGLHNGISKESFVTEGENAREKKEYNCTDENSSVSVEHSLRCSDEFNSCSRSEEIADGSNPTCLEITHDDSNVNNASMKNIESGHLETTELSNNTSQERTTEDNARKKAIKEDFETLTENSENEIVFKDDNSDSSSSMSTPSVALYDDGSTNSTDLFSHYETNEDVHALPKEMIEEERRLTLQIEIEMNKNVNNTIQLSKKEKEKRYKSLMSLLGKSKEYASYMSKKLAESKEETAEREMNKQVLQNTTNVTPGGKRKKTTQGKRASKKTKTENEQRVCANFNPETHYVNRCNLIVSRRQPETLIGGVMRDYQLDGLEWMVALYKNGVNGILADEMGLGKTIQVISLLCHLREKRIYGPHLIIAPLSTLPNWIFEFANFAPDIPVILFHGDAEKRRIIRNGFINIVVNKERDKLPVVLTSYEMPLYDKNFLSAISWCYTIVDEGHRLKNYQSHLSIELRRYKTESRLLLTGTPLQNNLTELWSLLNYLIPEIFNDLGEFENLFDFSDLTDSEKQNQLIQKEKEEQIVSKMHQILEPFLLRRVKNDVNIAIPNKKEILVYAPLTPEQEHLYRSVLNRSIINEATPEELQDVILPADGKRSKRRVLQPVSYSEDWDIDENTEYELVPKALLQYRSKIVGRVNKGDIDWVYNLKFANPFMMLRKIINHPYLVKTPVYPGTRDIIINEDLIKKAGKLLVLDALLPRLKADGHKVLLFSTFTLLLDLVEDYVLLRNYKYVRLDGSCAIENRLNCIKQFNSDKDTFIFLLSTRAGGLGINLTAADTVILYDSDWNPQCDLQAQDRCHRIGQTRPVVVYRLVTAGTADEHIVNRAVSKRRLEKLVVKQEKFKQKQSTQELISITELQELLQSTDYKQVLHPNGLVLSDQEITKLLDRSDLLTDNQASTADRMDNVKLLKDDNTNDSY